ncbi:heme-binding domain-containing protein [Aquimarina macrocephali]|uniref:heme-binding domain-containing protein n=1 Tax=Aquimarina macrocephali TaxID=666563 RepID=UPI003F667BB9
MIKRILFLFVLVFLISQFLRPTKNEASYDSIATFEATTTVSAEVKSILQNQCYDCHSNVTRYPWYMEVSPVSHWMAYHIKEGKEHFNVSEWEFYTDKQKDHKLEEFIEMIEKKEMPLESYTWMHGKLPANDAEKLINWAKETRETITKGKEKPQEKATDSLPVKVSDSTVLDSI